MPITNFRAGNVVTDTPSNLITLRCYVTTAAHYSGMMVNGAAYQVPAGKTLYITKLIFTALVANDFMYIWHDSLTVAADAAALTDGIQMTERLPQVVVNTMYPVDCLITIPASRWPALQSSNGNGSLTAFGYVV